MKYISLAIVLLLITSCGKNNDDNSFEFNLENSYRIESTGEEVKTMNGYSAGNMPFFYVYLSDAEIGSQLDESCCGSPWNYIINPKTEVQISFAKNRDELDAGIYTYNRNDADNDFVISINNEMVFDSDDKLLAFDQVVNYYSLNSQIAIDNARIELIPGQFTVELNYEIETIEGLRVVGSYIGPLENFDYNACYADCD